MTDSVITFIDSFDIKRLLLKHLYKHNFVVQCVSCSINNDATLLGTPKSPDLKYFVEFELFLLTFVKIYLTFFQNESWIKLFSFVRFCGTLFNFAKLCEIWTSHAKFSSTLWTLNVSLSFLNLLCNFPNFFKLEHLFRHNFGSKFIWLTLIAFTTIDKEYEQVEVNGTQVTRARRKCLFQCFDFSEWCTSFKFWLILTL